MRKPIAVLISDVHFQMSNLKLAQEGYKTAINKASELQVPLYDLGDTTNNKSVLRAEEIDILIDTMNYAKEKNVEVTLLVGNHSLLNSKSSDHALKFLQPYVKRIIDMPLVIKNQVFIPYQQSVDDILLVLDKLKPQFTKNPIFFMHQGFNGASMGHYIRDTTSIDPQVFKDYKVFTGHYHKHQSIGTITYVGSPMTHSFTEAGDDKGFLVLYNDCSYEQVLLPLRKHIIITRDACDAYKPYLGINPGDLLWVKISGPYADLKGIKKDILGIPLQNYKLELIPDKTNKILVDTTKSDMDLLIDSIKEIGDGDPVALLALAKELLS